MAVGHRALRKVDMLAGCGIRWLYRFGDMLGSTLHSRLIRKAALRSSAQILVATQGNCWCTIRYLELLRWVQILLRLLVWRQLLSVQVCLLFLELTKHHLSEILFMVYAGLQVLIRL